MSEERPDHVDDLDEVDTRPLPTNSSFNLDLDDAFLDDGEDHLDFTPAAMREEISKNFSAESSWVGDDEPELEEMQSSVHSPSVGPDDSVSTIDINAQTSSFDDPSSTSNFVSISPPQPSLDDSHRKSLQESISYGRIETPGAYLTDAIDVSRSSASPVPLAAKPTGVQDVAPDPQSRRHNSTNASVSSLPSTDGAVMVAGSSALPSSLSNGSPSTHRPVRSSGPSALEKVVSKTRPSFLPPKSKEEDEKHLADWEAMMKRSRATEQQRRKALQERRLARERAIEQSMEIWEKEVLPDWKAALRDPGIKKLWWNGIPPRLRAFFWERAVGNALALSKDTYRTCIARAKRSISSGSFPTTTLHLIDEDIKSTLPALRIFSPDSGPLYQDLKDLLCAWVVSRSDEGLGYTRGASKIAAMFLLNMTPTSAFMAMRNLMERHCMRSFYGGLASKDDVEAYYRIFDTLLADGLPKIYFNFKQHQISPAAYLPEWLLPLFLDHLPLEACARIWDVLLLEGDSFLYRVALAILGVLESRLFFPERSELLGLLRGENKAALELAKRDGRVLNGGKYEIYGVDEETLWARIEEMDEWWKESTWARLIQRELPDL